MGKLKVDSNGLFYVEDKDIVQSNINVDQRIGIINRGYNAYFYPIEGLSDYVVKYEKKPFEDGEIDDLKKMLAALVSRQENIKLTDLPIGYSVNEGQITGTIIKYYPNSVSLDNLLKTRNISNISEHYHRDDNPFHNLFMLFHDVLKILEELLNNGIAYRDVNAGNIIITDNQVKLIDFDHFYVEIDKNEEFKSDVYFFFSRFIEETLEYYHLRCPNFYIESSESSAGLDRLEERISKGR